MIEVMPHSDKVIPPWVKCKVCGGKPVGLNWLKPVSLDPNCREFIHMDCMAKDA